MLISGCAGYYEKSPSAARASLSHALAQSEGQFWVGTEKTLSTTEVLFAPRAARVMIQSDQLSGASEQRGCKVVGWGTPRASCNNRVYTCTYRLDFKTDSI